MRERKERNGQREREAKIKAAESNTHKQVNPIHEPNLEAL